MNNESAKKYLYESMDGQGGALSIKHRYALDTADDKLLHDVQRKLDEIFQDVINIYRQFNPGYSGPEFVSQVVDPSCTYISEDNKVLIPHAWLESKRIPYYLCQSRITMVRIAQSRDAIQRKDVSAAVEAAIDAGLALGVLFGFANAPGAKRTRAAGLQSREAAYGLLKREALRIAINGEWSSLSEAAKEIYDLLPERIEEDQTLQDCRLITSQKTVQIWLQGMPELEFKRLFPRAFAARERQRAKEAKTLVSFDRSALFSTPYKSSKREKQGA